MTTWKTMKSRIYRATGNLTSGIYDDEYWKIPHALLKIIENVCEANGYALDMRNARYEEENGVPVRKIWNLCIIAPNGKERFSRMVAHGAGTVKDPLSRYDVTLGIY